MYLCRHGHQTHHDLHHGPQSLLGHRSLRDHRHHHGLLESRHLLSVWNLKQDEISVRIKTTRFKLVICWSNEFCTFIEIRSVKST